MRFWQSNISIWLLISLGIVFATEIAAALSVAFVQLVFPSFPFYGETLIIFFVSVLLVGLLVGLYAWRLFVESVRSTQTTPLRKIFLGIVFGIVSSLIAHPLVWICCVFLSYFLNVDFILHARQLNLISMLVYISIFPLMSLCFVGWITTIVGGIAGSLFACLQMVLTRHVPQWDENLFLPKV
jgi:hypothetical protein